MILERFQFDAPPHRAWVPTTSTWGRSINGLPKSRIEKVWENRRNDHSPFRFTVEADSELNSYRAEVTGDGSGVGVVGTTKGLVVGDERWYAFSCCPSVDTFSDSKLIEIIWQTHITQNSGGTRNPPLSLYSKGGVAVFNHRYNSNVNGTNETNARMQPVVLGQFYPNVWVNFIIRTKLAHTGPGITQVWMDGRLVYSNLTDPNFYNDTGRTGYVKFGLYVPGWRDAVLQSGLKRTWYFDTFIIGDASESFASMAAELSKPELPDVIGDQFILGSIDLTALPYIPGAFYMDGEVLNFDGEILLMGE